jgi:hypothetical protein
MPAAVVDGPGVITIEIGGMVVRAAPGADRKRCCVPTLSAGAPAAKCEPTGRTGSHLWLTI